MRTVLFVLLIVLSLNISLSRGATLISLFINDTQTQNPKYLASVDSETGNTKLLLELGNFIDYWGYPSTFDDVNKIYALSQVDPPAMGYIFLNNKNKTIVDLNSYKGLYVAGHNFAPTKKQSIVFLANRSNGTFVSVDMDSLQVKELFSVNAPENMTFSYDVPLFVDETNQLVYIQALYNEVNIAYTFALSYDLGNGKLQNSVNTTYSLSKLVVKDDKFYFGDTGYVASQDISGGPIKILFTANVSAGVGWTDDVALDLQNSVAYLLPLSQTSHQLFTADLLTSKWSVVENVQLVNVVGINVISDSTSKLLSKY